MSEILVSVLTPCYNSEHTIERTLQSIEQQTYKNIEYIIIDGGSTDRTLEIIEEHRSTLPEKFILVSEKDNGIYDAMNKGIKLASGSLVGIVNSDDWYENDTVEQIVKNYKGKKYEVVYGMQRNFLNGIEKAIFIYNHEFLSAQMITHPTCFVTRNVYTDFGMFDLQYKSAADYEFMLNLWESKKTEFTPVLRVLSNFQLGGMSSSQIGVRENAKIRYKHGYMSKKAYVFIIIKSYIYQWTH